MSSAAHASTHPSSSSCVDHTLPFEGLAKQYNFRHASSRSEIFTRLVVEELARAQRQGRALDIGCGKGIERNLDLTRCVRDGAGELWGIEPDTGIPAPEGVFTNYQHAVMETANVPENHFDAAYSWMVMEHVQEPGAYMRAVHRTLKPGGCYLFGTINRAHYFARIANTLRVLKLDELMLRVLRGKQEVEGYHYPTAYKYNHPSVIDRSAKELGFEPPEYVFLEQQGPSPYFPGPLKGLLYFLNKKRDLVRNPRSLLVMICRMRKKK